VAFVSASIEVFGFPSVTPAQAPGLLVELEHALRDINLVTGEDCPDATYGRANRTLRPGPAALAFAGWGPREDGAVTGVSFHGPGYGNFLGMNMSDLTCGACGAHWGPDAPGYGDLFNTLGESTVPFTGGGPLVDVPCPGCGQGQDINAWFGQLILAHAAVEVWNWSSLNPTAPRHDGPSTHWPHAATLVRDTMAKTCPQHALQDGWGRL